MGNSLAACVYNTRLFLISLKILIIDRKIKCFAESNNIWIKEEGKNSEFARVV
jgi:hypothetical protein